MWGPSPGATGSLGMEALRGRGSARVMGGGRVEEWGSAACGNSVQAYRAEGAFLAPGEDGEVGAGRAGCSWERPEHSCLLPALLPFRAPPACCPSELRLPARGGREGGPAPLHPGPPEERAWQGPARPAGWDPRPTASLCDSAALPPRSAGSQVTRTKPGPQSRNNQAPEPDSCPSALLPTRMPAWGGTEAAPP